MNRRRRRRKKRVNIHYVLRLCEEGTRFEQDRFGIIILFSFQQHQKMLSIYLNKK